MHAAQRALNTQRHYARPTATKAPTNSGIPVVFSPWHNSTGWHFQFTLKANSRDMLQVIARYRNKHQFLQYNSNTRKPLPFKILNQNQTGGEKGPYNIKRGRNSTFTDQSIPSSGME